jgi:hypothetical protein
MGPHSMPPNHPINISTTDLSRCFPYYPHYYPPYYRPYYSGIYPYWLNDDDYDRSIPPKNNRPGVPKHYYANN